MVNSVSNKLRISGLASGLDTEGLVKQLMDAERGPLIKLQQNRQLLEWKKDSYRDMTNLLRGFKDQFLNVLNPSSNMTSANSYKQFTAQSSNTSVVTITANGSATPGNHSIKVTSLAEAAKAESSSGVTQLVSGPVGLDYTDGNNQFNITLNGVTKTISLRTDIAYTDSNDLVNNATYGLQALVDTAFGGGKIAVADAGGQVVFAPVNGKMSLTDGATNNALSKLNFTSGAATGLDTSATLATLAPKMGLTFNGLNELNFTINGANFNFKNTDTLSTVISKINADDTANVTLSYSDLNDKFTLVSDKTGLANSINITNTDGNLFGAGSAINITAATINNGKDALVDIDGVTNIANSENTFTVAGINYSLKGTGGPVDLTLTQDVDGIYNNIKTFVEKYNELISKVNTEISEQTFRDYKPLSDEQKEAMKEDDIKLWEEKAKSGLLRNDSTLQKIITDMRRAMSDKITSINSNLSEIGITTGLYFEKGKLVIDETKLKDAIKNNPSKVQDIFIKDSTIAYSPDLNATDRAQRYKEAGIINRIDDILQDAIRMTRNTKGKKGSLLEIAGIAGDISNTANYMTKQINSQNQKINELTVKLNRKESSYYKKFAALEKAMSQMSSQGNWLASQLGG